MSQPSDATTLEDVHDAIPSAYNRPGRKREYPSGQEDYENYTIDKYMDLEDSDFEYYMKNKSRGIAIIINNTKFAPQTNLEDRTSSVRDKDNLVETLRSLDFEKGPDRILVKENLKAAEMRDLMESAAGKDYTDRDCVFVAILSHGDKGHVYGVDLPIEISSLTAPFKNERATTLVGKPKIFVIQACQGKGFDAGANYVSDALVPEEAARRKKYLISKESDVLVAYSTVPGFLAWRNTEKGSWFIRALCEVLKGDGKRLDLLTLLTRTSRMVSFTYASNADDSEQPHYKQSPFVESTLTKTLYFS